MDFKYTITKSIANTVSLFSSDQPKPGLRVLMYHAVGTAVRGDDRGIFTVHPDQFAEQMAYLVRHSDFEVVDLEGAALGGRSCRVAVTFDDGYRDNLTIATPILEKLGIPFTVFLAADLVQRGRPDFLSPEQIRELAGMPLVRIGAHGMSHKRLTTCTEDELKEELEGGRGYLEELIGREVTMMAYPFGAVDERVVRAVKKTGYQRAVCSQFGINEARGHPLLLKRTEISGLDDLRAFDQKLKGGWDWYGLRP